MTVPTLVVRPDAAANAYRRVEAGAPAIGGGADFSGTMARALAAAVDTGRAAEAQSMHAIAGAGDITEVVAAVAKAELALQTTVAVRDRVVQAYQDIMRMPI